MLKWQANGNFDNCAVFLLFSHLQWKLYGTYRILYMAHLLASVITATIFSLHNILFSYFRLPKSMCVYVIGHSLLIIIFELGFKRSSSKIRACGWLLPRILVIVIDACLVTSWIASWSYWISCYIRDKPNIRDHMYLATVAYSSASLLTNLSVEHAALHGIWIYRISAIKLLFVSAESYPFKHNKKLYSVCYVEINRSHY